MVERGEDFGFALESGEPFRVKGDVRRQHLDRHLALQLRVRRPIYLSHSAHADLGSDLIGAEPSAGSQGQVADYTGREASGRRSLLCNGLVFTEGRRPDPWRQTDRSRPGFGDSTGQRAETGVASGQQRT